MKRKIFISINLPSKTKKRLNKAVQKWQDMPVKWVKEENLHITLFFLGFVDDDTSAEICQKITNLSEAQEIFDMEFNTIELGPTMENPNQIWLTGEANEDLKNLVEAIEKELGTFTSEKKSFRPHITLGRIRKHKWEALDNKPEISEKFPLLVTAESVDVMASDFDGGDMEYAVIESCPLK